MGNIRNLKGNLFFDFRYQGKRCREYTKLTDTPINRKKMLKVLERIDAEITLGSFNYASYFPNSKLAQQFAAQKVSTKAKKLDTSPLFKHFIETWFNESLPLWRDSHISTVRSTIDAHLTPCFGDRPVAAITKADVLAFRADVAKLPGRGGNKRLAPKTVNRILQILGQALAEAADRYEFTNPVDGVKRMRVQRTIIAPFTLEEAQRIIDAIRPDYRDYMIVRFFTGMRTGEINGLKKKYVDFKRRQILIRETIVRGKVDYTKTDGSQRVIHMSQPVFDALRRQFKVSMQHPEFVFCNREGNAVDLDNFTNRIWYPLLEELDLEKRRPYETRHTAATLWLASGENPEWVARQLGHTDTEMLFKTYSRFIPNLTHQDGSAFERLLSRTLSNPHILQPTQEEAQ